MNDIASGQKSSGLTPFFVITFAITWGIAAFLFAFPELFKSVFGAVSTSNPMFVLAVAAPTISATLVVLYRSGGRGLRALYAGLVRFRFSAVWYVVALLGVPAVSLVIALIFGLKMQIVSASPGMVLLVLLNLFYTGPLGEEVGWRGFALPRLMRRMSPLAASLVLGLVWAAWHLPSFFASGLPQTMSVLPWFMAGAVFLAVVASWLFIRTGGSVAASAFLHYTVNFSLTLLGLPIPALAVVMAAAAIAVVLFDRSIGWLQTPADASRDAAAATRNAMGTDTTGTNAMGTNAMGTDTTGTNS